MNTSQRRELGAFIARQIVETKSEIERYEALTRPIAPDVAIGRLSRMEAIGAKSIDESVLRGLRATLGGLENARKRIDDEDEDFGYCVDCDELIPFGRLKIFPHARRCVACEELHDRRRR